MEERQLGNWIDAYIEYTQCIEPSDKLNFWCGLAALSGAVKRQVKMRRVRNWLYPNLYILIVAESAVARKSKAMDTAIEIMRESSPDIDYISGSMTAQGLMKNLNKIKTIAKANGRVVLQNDAHVVIHADELAHTVGHDRVRAADFVMMLTELYNCPSTLPKTLSGEGQYTLENLYPVFLAGTDPKNLKVFPDVAEGGLIGRTIIVTENTRKRSIAWEEDEDTPLHRQLEQLKTSLIHDLSVIGNLKGEMVPTPNAKQYFEEWYNARDGVRMEDVRADAFYHRCHDTGLKLAMLIALGQSNDLVLNVNDVKRGLDYIDKQIPEFAKVANWTQQSDYSQLRARFIELMRKQGFVGSRRQMMTALMVSKSVIIELEESLESEERIVVTTAGKNYLYKMTIDEGA